MEKTISKEIILGIPADSKIAQLQRIHRAVEYGQTNNEKEVIKRIGKLEIYTMDANVMKAYKYKTKTASLKNMQHVSVENNGENILFNY